MAGQTSPNAARIAMIAILSGAALIAVIGTILPELLGLAGTPAIIMRAVFYAIAAIDVAVAVWLRARLRKARSARPDSIVRRR